MPSDKRARQRAAREARLAAEARQKKRRRQIRNVIIVRRRGRGDRGHRLPRLEQQPQRWPPSPPSPRTTTAAHGTNAKLQAQANEVAVKAGCPASTKTTVNTQKYAAAPPMTIDTTKTYTATVVTTAGTFVIALDAKTAPDHRQQLRVPGGQGLLPLRDLPPGHPRLHGPDRRPDGHRHRADPATPSRDENPPKAASRLAASTPLGSVAMANTGQPHSGGSQFFIVAGPAGREPAELLRALRPGDVGHERRRHHQPAGLGRRASRPTSPSASSPSPSTKRKDTTLMATPTPPAADGSSPQQRKFDEEPPMVIDTDQALRGDHDHLARHHGHRPRPPRRPEGGQQLRVPGPLPLLRRHRVPPHHPGLRAPGRRPHRDGFGWSGLPLRRRAAGRRPLQGRVAGHGQRGAQHQRQPVLRDQRPRRGAPAAALLALRRGRHRARRRRRRSTASAAAPARRPSGS